MRKQLRLKGLIFLTLMSSLCIYLLALSRGNHSSSTEITGSNSPQAAHSKIRLTQLELGDVHGNVRLTKDEPGVGAHPTSEDVHLAKDEPGVGAHPTSEDVHLAKDEPGVGAHLTPEQAHANLIQRIMERINLKESSRPIVTDDKQQTGDVSPELFSKPTKENDASSHHSSAPQDSRDSLKLNDAFRSEMESKMAAIEVLSMPIINDHNFEYVRNPEGACANRLTELLIVVPSAPENLEKRMKVRKGPVGDYVRTASNNAKLVFFVGEPECKKNAAKLQRDVDDEFQNYKDIVQDHFLDVYKNIRFKAVSMLRWAVTYCRHAKYVIRTDDDVTVNVTKIVSVVKRKGSELPDFILGDRKDGWRPVRHNDTYGLKYLVEMEEYPNSTYPPFAVGGLLGYPMSTVSLLYQAALRIKPIWLDDVFITGICAQRLKLPLIKDPDFVFQHKN